MWNDTGLDCLECEMQKHHEYRDTIKHMLTLLSKEFNEKVLSKPRYNDSEIKQILQHEDSLQPFISKIEKIFSAIPENRKKEVWGRFRSHKNRQHLSAVWELVIAGFLENEGFVVEWNGDGEPDFTIIDQQNKKYMFEIRGLYESDSQGLRNKIRDKIEIEINKLTLPGTLTLSCIHSLPLDMDIDDFVDSVDRWCKLFPVQENKGEFRYQKKGARVTIMFERSSDKNRRNIQHFLTTIEANRFEYVKNTALSEKGKKYGKRFSGKGLPIIVALADSSGSSISDNTIQSALIGSQTVSFFPGTDQTEIGLDGKGYITPKEAFRGAQNKWLSAVMFFQSNWIDGDQIIWSSLYRNYWAKNPADSTDFGARRVFQGKGIDDSTIRYDWAINDN